MGNHQNLLAGALSGSLALLGAVAPLGAQVGDRSGSVVPTPSPRSFELENAVPGWECPMPVVGLGMDDPSAPSGMPIAPIDSTAAVPMPTLRRHCLNPRANPGAGPGPSWLPGGFTWPRPSVTDTSSALPRGLERPHLAPSDTSAGRAPTPDPDG